MFEYRNFTRKAVLQMLTYDLLQVPWKSPHSKQVPIVQDIGPGSRLNQQDF